MQPARADLLHAVGQICNEVINCDGAAPPFLCSLRTLIEVSVMTHETVDLIGIQYAIVISLVQYSVAAVDAFQLRIIWKSFAVPVASFRKGYVTQATHSICSDVPASIKRLVAGQICRCLPLRFSAHGNYSLTDAILGVTCVIDNSCHDVCLIAAGIEAMQHLCHCTFKIKLRSRMLCSSAVCRSASLSL